MPGRQTQQCYDMNMNCINVGFESFVICYKLQKCINFIVICVSCIKIKNKLLN